METSYRKIKMSEFKKNNGEDGNKLWVLIDNKVYDVTDFSHPGGNEILMDDHGSDRFDEFESIHSPAAKKQMAKYLIGEIDSSNDGENDKKENKKINNDKKNDEFRSEKDKKSGDSSSNLIVFIPILFIVVFLVYKFVLSKN